MHTGQVRLPASSSLWSKGGGIPIFPALWGKAHAALLQSLGGTVSAYPYTAGHGDRDYRDGLAAEGGVAVTAWPDPSQSGG